MAAQRSHSATGNPRGRPLAASKVAAIVGSSTQGEQKQAPIAPSHFDADSLAMWEQTWNGASHLTQSRDLLSVTLLCETFSEREYLRRRIATGDTPRFYRLQNGAMATHPIVAQLKDSEMRLQTLISNLALDPMSAARLGTEDALSATIRSEFDRKSKADAERKAARRRVHSGDTDGDE